MLKKLSIILVFTCLSLTVRSQFIHSVEYKTGINVSAIKWELLPHYNNAPENYNIMFPDDYIGFSTAFNFKYLNHKYWNLSTQFGYSQIGGSDKFTFTSVTGTSIEEKKLGLRMDYVNMNLLLELKYTLGKFTPSIKTGPHLDYLTSAYAYADNFNRVNYGLEVGGSIEYTFNKNLYLNADCNYYWYNNKIKTSTLEVSITKNASLMLGIGYKF
ncbi:MAG: outer membrane beta-barrel protein [Bacteroidales bacterium]